MNIQTIVLKISIRKSKKCMPVAVLKYNILNFNFNCFHRLAEGHAKFMFRSEVLVADAIFATELIYLTNGIGKDYSQFPKDPLLDYRKRGNS